MSLAKLFWLPVYHGKVFWLKFFNRLQGAVIVEGMLMSFAF